MVGYHESNNHPATVGESNRLRCKENRNANGYSLFFTAINGIWMKQEISELTV